MSAQHRAHRQHKQLSDNVAYQLITVCSFATKSYIRRLNRATPVNYRVAMEGSSTPFETPIIHACAKNDVNATGSAFRTHTAPSDGLASAAVHAW